MKNTLVKSSAAPDPARWAMVIGRFQPFHSGHRWMVEHILAEGSRVLICVRDMPVDASNPWTAAEVEAQIKRDLWPEVGRDRVRVMVVPDIGSVNIGRDVGYDVVEWVPPPEVAKVSATAIRRSMGGGGWAGFAP